MDVLTSMRFQEFMMRLLASTDYALRVLIALGQSGSTDTKVETLETSLGDCPATLCTRSSSTSRRLGS